MHRKKLRYRRRSGGLKKETEKDLVKTALTYWALFETECCIMVRRRVSECWDDDDDEDDDDDDDFTVDHWRNCSIKWQQTRSFTVFGCACLVLPSQHNCNHCSWQPSLSETFACFSTNITRCWQIGWSFWTLNHRTCCPREQTPARSEQRMVCILAPSIYSLIWETWRNQDANVFHLFKLIILRKWRNTYFSFWNFPRWLFRILLPQPVCQCPSAFRDHLAVLRRRARRVPRHHSGFPTCVCRRCPRAVPPVPPVPLLPVVSPHPVDLHDLPRLILDLSQKESGEAYGCCSKSFWWVLIIMISLEVEMRKSAMNQIIMLVSWASDRTSRFPNLWHLAVNNWSDLKPDKVDRQGQSCKRPVRW